MHRMQEPARRVGRGHPAAPLQDEIQRDVELDEEREDRNRDQRNEHEKQLGPERAHMSRIRNLDGVAERSVEEIEPDAESDLELVDEDQEEDVDARIEALADGHSRQRPRANGDRRLSLEERIAQRNHPADEGKVRNAEDGDAEESRREGEIARQRIVRISPRPVAEQRDDVGEAEQDRLDREEIGENGEKGRGPPSGLRSDRPDGRGDPDDEHHRVFFVGPDDQREDGEGGEAQHALHRAGP